MTRWRLSLILTATLALSSCTQRLSSQQNPSQWSTGFWYWYGTEVDPSWNGDPLDLLYVHAGTIRGVTDFQGRARWFVGSHLPGQLPVSRHYWLVFRYEQEGLPHSQAIPAISRDIGEIIKQARARKMDLAGIQLDIDSPTASLHQYAAFLRELRNNLPPGCELSITALLDWFRSGTAISDVIAQVDEFVPQFYDLAASQAYIGEVAVAAKIDPQRWGPFSIATRRGFASAFPASDALVT